MDGEARALEVTQSETGEIVQFEPGAEDLYRGISVQAIAPEAAKVLAEPINPDDIEVRPDGQIYYPEMKYRVLLNRAFGIAGWGMRPMGPALIREDLVMQTWALYVQGRFISQATGECKLASGNDQMTYGDILEGAKSVAIRRLCKDLGIAADLWDRSFVVNFLNTHCVKVFIDGKPKPQWRKCTAPMFYKETKVADDSPNKDKVHGYPPKQNKPEQNPETKPEQKAEQKPDPQPTSNPSRPYTPEVLKKAIAKRAEKHADSGQKASDKYRGLVCGMMELAWDGQTHQERELNRHSVLAYLTGKDSMKEVPDWYVHAIAEWLKWDTDSGGLSTLPQVVIQELNGILLQTLEDAGQQKLPEGG